MHVRHKLRDHIKSMQALNLQSAEVRELGFCQVK